jgi:hypothetical protein
MKDFPIVDKLLCVGLVATLMFPLGQVIQPYIADVMDNLQFGTLEALVSAALGYGIYATLFG